jgi:hypothetical protein
MTKLILAMTAIALIASVDESSAQGDNRTGYFLSEINKAKALVDKYISPEHQIYLVDIAGEDWLFRAVSKNERDKWLKTTQFTVEEGKKINDALDALNASAEKKLPLYKPESKRFAYGTSEEKEMMKSKISGVQDLTIHKIGLADEVWQVVKDGTGTPKYRYRAGYIWFKNNNKSLVDHPWCRVFQINISQNYQGGGTYGASFAGYQTRWLCGCP